MKGTLHPEDPVIRRSLRRLLALFVAASSFALVDWVAMAPVAEGALAPARPGAFRTVGRVTADPSLHNFEVVPLPNGGYRLYCHRITRLFGALSSDGLRFTSEPEQVLTGAMPAVDRLPGGGCTTRVARRARCGAPSRGTG